MPILRDRNYRAVQLSLWLGSIIKIESLRHDHRRERRILRVAFKIVSPLDSFSFRVHRWVRHTNSLEASR